MAERIEQPTIDSLKPLVEQALRDLGGQAHRSKVIAGALALGDFNEEQTAEPTHSLGKRDAYESELEYRLSWALTNCGKDGTVEKIGEGYWRLAGR